MIICTDTRPDTCPLDDRNPTGTYRRRVKAYLILLACFVSILVGISRVHMGVHWPTDVLAGWTLGASWALLCWLAAYWLQRKGAVEKDDPF